MVGWRRLVLRQDNVFYRLYKKAFEYSLITKSLYDAIDKEYTQALAAVELILSNNKIKIPLTQQLSSGEDEKVKKYIKSLCDGTLNARQQEYIFAEILYHPYHAREKHEIAKLQEFRSLVIPVTFSYSDIPGLSIELQQKLSLIKPATIAQASLINGMTPAALSLLIFKIRT